MREHLRACLDGRSVYFEGFRRESFGFGAIWLLVGNDPNDTKFNDGSEAGSNLSESAKLAAGWLNNLVRSTATTTATLSVPSDIGKRSELSLNELLPGRALVAML